VVPEVRVGRNQQELHQRKTKRTKHMNDISKLPKWAQDLIASFERQRNTAIHALNEFLNDQEKSNVFTQSYEPLGDKDGPRLIKRFIQTNQVKFAFETGTNHDDVIDVCFNDRGELRIAAEHGVINMRPEASNVIAVWTNDR